MPSGIRIFTDKRIALAFAKSMSDNGVATDVRHTDVSEYRVYFGNDVIFADGKRVEVKP